MSTKNSAASMPTRRPAQQIFFGVPATNIITKPVGNNTSAEPRSGSFKISANGSSISPMPFQKIHGCRNSSAGRLKKMRRRQNERELGEFARLKLENAQVNPPPRAKAHRPMCGISTATRQMIVAQYTTNDQRASV
jgi:hypothetical protein